MSDVDDDLTLPPGHLVEDDLDRSRVCWRTILLSVAGFAAMAIRPELDAAGVAGMVIATVLGASGVAATWAALNSDQLT